MGHWFDRTDDVTTVHLGQFSRETANEIAGELEGAGIVWWYKDPGFLAQIWEHGVRLFVDKSRLAEAKAIAERIVAERNAPSSGAKRSPGASPELEAEAEGEAPGGGGPPSST